MMMFARLKPRSIQPIEWLIALNITIAILVAVQARTFSPVITGFSIVAALSAGLVLYLLRAEPALAPSDASAPAQDQRPASKPAPSPLALDNDRMAEIAELLCVIKPAASSNAASAERLALRQLEEALRRLANGDAAQLLSVNFPEQLNGLRFQFNRLASTLQVNLLPTSRAVLDLRENAYGAQESFVLLSAGMDKMHSHAKSLGDAINLLTNTLRTSTRNAERVCQSHTDMQQRSIRAGQLIHEIDDYHTAAQTIRHELDTICRKTADLAIHAEQFASAPDQHHEAIRRSHASDCVDIARSLMQSCHAMATTLEAGSKGIAQLRHELGHWADAVTQQGEPGDRLAQDLCQELGQITKTQALTREITSVTKQLSAMADHAESRMLKIMSGTTTIETRLSLFKAKPAETVVGMSATTKAPHLRCVT